MPQKDDDSSERGNIRVEAQEDDVIMGLLVEVRERNWLLGTSMQD